MQWFWKNDLSIIQLTISLIFLYYSFVETNRFYCVLTGRQGLFYLAEDVVKLIRAAHLETEQEQRFLPYLRQLALLIWQKGLQKIHRHFIHSTATFAQKAVQKYSENLVEICAPNWSGGGGVSSWEKGGWYGYMESTIRIFTRPTEMGYCFLDSNRIFNSFLNMETEKYFLQCKINLVSIGTTVCLGVPMFYRAVNHLIVEIRPPRLAISSQGAVEDIVDISEKRSRRRRRRRQNSMK